MTLWNRSLSLALLSAGTASLTLAASATCTSPKCAIDVANATSSNVSVIVQYANDPGDDEVSAITGRIGPVYNRMHTIKAIAARVPITQLDSLANRAGVKYISLDRFVEARQSVAPIGSSPEFTAEPINAPSAWAKDVKGDAIGIAVIDSGITPNADLSFTQTPSVLPPAAPPSSVVSELASLASTPVTGPVVSATGSSGLLGGVVSLVGGLTGGLTGGLVSSLVGGLGGVVTTTTKAVTVPYSGTSRVVYSYNFTSTDATDTADAYGHGTHVAGLIAGNGANSTGSQYTRTFVGIAPNAYLINLRALDANGEGSDSTVIAAIEAAILLKDTYNIKVINLSLGRPIYESYTQDPLCQAVEQAWKAGIVVVTAAGNDGRDLALNPEGYGTIEAPGNDPYVITVGATNTMNTAAVNDDVMASYSSKGPTFIDEISKPDLIAPGNLVTSLLAPDSNLQSENPAFYTPLSWYIADGSSAASTTYFPLSGTSMATAVASGAVADVLQAAPGLTPDQVKVLLMTSANKGVIPQSNTVVDPSSGPTAYIAHNDVFTQGAGYLDLEAALNNTHTAGAIPPNGSAMSPVANFSSSSGNVVLVPDPTSVWAHPGSGAASGMLSAGAVYGQNAFVPSGSTALWNNTPLAGAGDPNAFTALWGSGSTWSSGSTDASTALWGRSSEWGAGTSDGTGTSSGATALWGRSAPAGSTALWGRDTTGSSSTTSGSTALWGRDTTEGSSTTSSSTALWGRSTPDTN